jgi:hypothetical protein
MLPLDSPNSPPVDMKTRLVYWLTMQGLGVVALAVFCYVQWQDSRQYREETKACNAEMVRIYQAQNERLIEVLADIRDYMHRNPSPAHHVSK